METTIKDIIIQREYSVEYVTSRDSRNELFYAYLLMPRMLVKAFRELLGKVPLNLNEFGVVLASGKGTPSEDVKAEIRSKFPHADL